MPPTRAKEDLDKAIGGRRFKTWTELSPPQRAGPRMPSVRRWPRGSDEPVSDPSYASPQPLLHRRRQDGQPASYIDEVRFTYFAGRPGPEPCGHRRRFRHPGAATFR